MYTFMYIAYIDVFYHFFLNSVCSVDVLCKVIFCIYAVLLTFVKSQYGLMCVNFFFFLFLCFCLTRYVFVVF